MKSNHSKKSKDGTKGSARESALVSLTSNEVGKIAESIVEKRLTAKGYSFLGRNIRIGNKGEIDLIFSQMSQKGAGKLIFIEVKSDLALVDLGLVHTGYSVSALPTLSKGVSEPLLNVYERISESKRKRLVDCAKIYAYKEKMANNKDYSNFDLDIYVAHVSLMLNDRIFKKVSKKLTKTASQTSSGAKNIDFANGNQSGLFDGMIFGSQGREGVRHTLGFSHIEFFRI